LKETDPYAGLSPDNFDMVKKVLLKAIEMRPTPTPDLIAQEISKQTGMEVSLARQLVAEEFISAMNWMKDAKDNDNL